MTQEVGEIGRMSPGFRQGLAEPLLCGWRNRHLVRRLVARDFNARFRGAVFGRIWAGAAPMLMLLIYTYAFDLFIQPQWQAVVTDRNVIPLTYYSGLMAFQFLIDAVVRAPNLIRENAVYVKRVVFPVEIFAWVLSGSVAIRLAISFAVFLLFHLALAGLPRPSVALMPLALLPLALMTTGFVWFLAGIGTYIRDVGLAVIVLSPVVMFVSPIFYPLSAAPESARAFLFLNPLTLPIEAMRAAMFERPFEHWPAMAVYCLLSVVILVAGHRFFMRVRPGFADVL